MFKQIKTIAITLILILLEFRISSSTFQGIDILQNKITLSDQTKASHNNYNLVAFPDSVFGASFVWIDRNVFAYFYRHGK